MATQIQGNWWELDCGDPRQIVQALGLLKSTYTYTGAQPAGTIGFNYNNLAPKHILRKMVRRQNKNGDWAQGLRICQRIVPPAPAAPAIPTIDIVLFYFLRLRSANSMTTGDAYCMTVGVDTSVTDATTLHTDAWMVCKYIQKTAVEPSSATPQLVDTFEIMNADALPYALQGLASAAVLTSAFNMALGTMTPTPGKIQNPPNNITVSAAWHTNANNSNQMRSWPMTI